ncbi:tigger transposable element-derived protein [Elysia marginata]|uniref:Tigger transposable element-derived protein n=1 Tax=Elysia marginata TaxID=1093978 RepID=A0AAV4EU73_9GAST|nr:tigger transposable element-derived protein [Elysia marginata]
MQTKLDATLSKRSSCNWHQKGQKRVGSIVSQEKGVTVTMCGAISATGNSIPPFLVFPRVNVQEHWTLSAPAGTVCEGHPKASEWMTTENFIGFLRHFVKHTRPSEDLPVLLIVDHHASHCGVEVIDFARQNHVTLLSFPPHCSHQMQPLDKTVYGPFQKFYDQAVDLWMRAPENVGKQMSIHSVPSMISYAFPKAFTISNMTSGFRSTGIYPLDPNIFPEERFLSTYSTDRPVPLPSGEGSAATAPLPSTAPQQTNGLPQELPTSSDCYAQGLVSPKDVRPLPKAPPRKEGARKRKAVKSAILTVTPEKKAVHSSSFSVSLPAKQSASSCHTTPRMMRMPTIYWKAFYMDLMIWMFHLVTMVRKMNWRMLRNWGPHCLMKKSSALLLGTLYSLNVKEENPNPITLERLQNLLTRMEM